MRDIYILHENSEWVTPLHAAFAERGVTAREWFLDEGAVALDSVPPEGIFYNRMSASSHTRGHRFAPELTRMALTWLEQHGRTVVNGTAALYLEVCKVSQYAALERAGIKTPATRAVVGKARLQSAAAEFDRWPFILKPNRGGKGLGVQLIRSADELQAFVEGNDYQEPLDGIWLLQQYVAAAAPYITRCEFVGGEFVYAVRVSTDDGFELCPADSCSLESSFCPAEGPASSKFSISHDYDQHPIIARLAKFLVESGIDVAGIELIQDSRGEIYVYDVNTNTNYNARAEAEAGVERGGMAAIADHLISLAKR